MSVSIDLFNKLRVWHEDPPPSPGGHVLAAHRLPVHGNGARAGEDGRRYFQTFSFENSMNFR